MILRGGTHERKNPLDRLLPGDVRSNIKLYAKLKDLILGGRNV